MIRRRFLLAFAGLAAMPKAAVSVFRSKPKPDFDTVLERLMVYKPLAASELEATLRDPAARHYLKQIFPDGDVFGLDRRQAT